MTCKQADGKAASIQAADASAALGAAAISAARLSDRGTLAEVLQVQMTLVTYMID